tara:strand:- start:575 stop:1564 length:990 start_codon:yes stop_codon:yes gene_type:complete
MNQHHALILNGEPTIRDYQYEIDCYTDQYVSCPPKLISYPYRYPSHVTDVLEDNIEIYVYGFINGGGACVQVSPFNWLGSGCVLVGTTGYWLKINEGSPENQISPLNFTFINGCDDLDCSTLARQFDDLLSYPNNYEFMQSTRQAFYFLDNIENVEIGDWILSFNDETVIGARQWEGKMIDVPVMGSDGQDYSKNYILEGEVPDFRILKDNLLIDISGQIPAWSDNQIFVVNNLVEKNNAIPKQFKLENVYPNPFNPITTLSFTILKEKEVNLSIFNVQGKLIQTLIDERIDKGYHEIQWDASLQSSGIYFVKLISGDQIDMQKLMLIK